MWELVKNLRNIPRHKGFVCDCYFLLFLTKYIYWFCIRNKGHKSFTKTLNTQIIHVTTRNNS